MPALYTSWLPNASDHQIASEIYVDKQEEQSIKTTDKKLYINKVFFLEH